MTSLHHDPSPGQWFSRSVAALDRRSAPRLVLLFLGAILARGRRTVTAWIRAAGLSGQFRPCYTAVAAAGRPADRITAFLALAVVKPLAAGIDRLTLALDDTPTPRHGPHVQGQESTTTRRPDLTARSSSTATPGSSSRRSSGTGPGAPSPCPCWPGCMSGPRTCPAIPPGHRPAFRTKPQLSVELFRWATAWLGLLGKPLWVVAYGAYAKEGFIKPARSLGVTVVSRLRRDAALRTVPGPKPPA